MNSPRPGWKLGSLALALAALSWSAGAQEAPLDSPPARQNLACGFKIGAPALAAWLSLGGRDGRLGCPTEDEFDAVPSFSGSRSREIVFGDTGAIFTRLSGPHSGGAVAIADCYRLYFQYGGAAGWLGLPLSDAENTPDGQKQAYEGGEMRFGRALGSCEAERADAK